MARGEKTFIAIGSSDQPIGYLVSGLEDEREGEAHHENNVGEYRTEGMIERENRKGMIVRSGREMREKYSEKEIIF